LLGPFSGAHRPKTATYATSHNYEMIVVLSHKNLNVLIMIAKIRINSEIEESLWNKIHFSYDTSTFYLVVSKKSLNFAQL
jgi:hypothetical protein